LIHKKISVLWAQFSNWPSVNVPAAFITHLIFTFASGQWGWMCQFGGMNFVNHVTCPDFMEGSCQWTNQAMTNDKCAFLGILRPEDFEVVNGQCTFKTIQLTQAVNNFSVKCNDIAIKGVQDSENLWLLFWSADSGENFKHDEYPGDYNPRQLIRNSS
jgi:hypothetical protein